MVYGEKDALVMLVGISVPLSIVILVQYARLPFLVLGAPAEAV